MANPIAPKRLQSGTVLEQYRIEAHLGSGGQAEVYLARDQLIGRFAAIKVFRQTGGQTIDAVIDEARLMAPLDDPHIVRVFHVGRGHKMAYMAMEASNPKCGRMMVKKTTKNAMT